MDKDTLRQEITNSIYTNTGGLVTGDVLQQVLLDMVEAIPEVANITGFVSVASISDLPTTGIPTIGYLVGTNLYLYVGTGGDTLGGKYQNCGPFRGPQGNSGYTGAAGELEVVNNLTEGGATAALSAEQGKELKDELDALGPVDDLHTSDTSKALSANQGGRLWGDVSRLMESADPANVVDLDVDAANIPGSASRLTGNFFLQAGLEYTFKAVFKNQPASGSQVNVWLQPAENAPGVGVVSSLYLYANSWNTEKKNTVTVQTSGMYYISFRYVYSTPPAANVLISVDNPLALRETKNGALANYFIPKGALAATLIKGQIWSEDMTPELNAYRICTQLFNIAHPHFRISCNYADGFTWYLYRWIDGTRTAVATNVGEDREFNIEDATTFFVAVRASGGRAVTDADLTACGLTITMLENTSFVVPDVDASIEASEERTGELIDQARALVLSEKTTSAEFVASSTSTKSVSSPFFLKGGVEYNLTAEFLDEPAEDAQVNVWVIPIGSAHEDGRVILKGGEGWEGPKGANPRLIPSGDGLYDIRYRCIFGGAQTARVSVVIGNPFYNGAGSDDDNKLLPDYYFPYIDERALEAKRQMAACGVGAVAMFFITDTHHPQNYGKSDAMLQYLNERLQVRNTLYGGDICPSLTSMWAISNPVDAIALSDNAVTKLLAGAKGRIYRTRGNHDYSVANYSYWQAGKSYKADEKVVWSEVYGGGDNHEYTCLEANSDATFDPTKWERGGIGGHNLSQIEAQRLILADAEAAGNCVFPDNGTKAAYYYFDIPRSKIRVVVWDVCDSDFGFRGISNVTQQITNSQFQWIIENAILTTPAGYKIVTFGHDPTYTNQRIGPGSDNIASAWNVKRIELIRAVNGKTTFTLGGQTYDFSQFGSEIVINLNGHTHADCITMVDGTCGVSIAGDWYNDYTKNSPVYHYFGLQSLASRVGGTTREQAFDIVIFDLANDFVKFLRFGAGVDRWVNLDRKTVAAGETLQIDSVLSGTLEYHVYDAALRSATPAANGAYYPTETLASIDTDGVLTAIAAGEVVVMAYDTDNKVVEVFGVTIE